MKNGSPDTPPVSDVTIVARHAADDGSCKYLLALGDARQVEAVYLPTWNRQTICVSSQVGCVLDCAFCATGALAFARNLSAAEIVNQLRVVARDRQTRDGDFTGFSNVVFMGMGEPFYNYENVLQAADAMSDPRGLNIARRRVTISTAGVLPAIERYFREERPYKLAISLTSALPAKRDRLMPINRRYSLADLRAVLDRYPARLKRRVLFEVPMLAGINDGPEDARALFEYCQGLPVRINLIPWNPVEIGTQFARPDDARVREFQRILRADGMPVFIRQSLGRDVNAACGQLALKPPLAHAETQPARR